MTKAVSRFYITDGGKPCVSDTHTFPLGGGGGLHDTKMGPVFYQTV